MSSPTSLTTAAASPGEARTAANCSADRCGAVAGWYESSWDLVSGLEVIEVLHVEAHGRRRAASVEPLSARA